MAKTTSYDPKRLLGGTIELVRDPKTGAYSTKTVGFSNLPAITLPQLGVTEVAKDATTTKTEADKALQAQTSAAFKTGSGSDDRDKDLDLSALRTSTFDDDAEKTSKLLTSTFDAMKEDETAADKSIDIKTPEIKTSTTIQDSMPRERKDVTDVFVGDEMAFTSIVPSRNDLTTGQIRQLNRGGQVTVNGRTFTKGQINKATIDRGAAFTDDKFGEFGATVGTTPIAGEFAGTGPDTGDQTLGISSDPTRVTGTKAAKEADFASGRLGIQKVDPTTKVASGFGMDPTAQTVTEQTASAKAAEEIKKKSSAGFPTGIKIAANLAGAAFGMLFGTKEDLSPTDQFKMGRFQTRFDLGSSTDPGRIVDRDADGNRTVFDGFNRNSAFGNLGQSAQKRTDRVRGYASKNRAKAASLRAKGDARSIAKAEKLEAKAARQQAKADKYQEQVNKYNKDKPVTGTTKPGESGGSDSKTDSGKIVCTMMNESYGFGSFRNKIWMKFHKDISPEYQKGYHKLFLPLVKYAKQKGITNKFIKNILEHIAVHSTIDMRQSLRGKRHTLGRVYRKIILPLCYWVGKK